ncbi:MAG: proton-conducting transporter membrane subunit [Candidatus Neomarinimicrobiota bacterium]
MILPFFIIIPLLAAFLIALISGDRDYWAIIVSVIALISLTVLSLFCFSTIGGKMIVYEMSAWKIPYTVCLTVDAFSAFMLVIVSGIGLTALMFSIYYIRHLSPSWKYYALFMLLITGMNGVIATGDLFNLFVFMEIALFAAFALVSYGSRAEEFEASFKYAIMGSISSTLVLVGIAVVYSATSTLTMAVIAQRLPQNPTVMYWSGGIFLAAFGLKAAIMPFHAWLPDAHSSAPAPISSMLSGVLIKSLGIYVLIRLFYNIYNAPPVFLTMFMVLGSVSILVASFLAIGQWDLKRLLAYSSISQIGFILLGVGIGTRWAIFGAVFHILNHAIFKALLFYNAGTVEMVLGTRDLRKMGNLTHILPYTTATSMVGTLSVSGIPPFNGFFSKLIIIIAAIAAGHPVYGGIAILGSLLTLVYFMKVQRYGFHGENMIEMENVRIGWGMRTAMILLAVLCLATSILIIPGIKEVTLDPVVDAIMNKTGYITRVLGR